MVFFKKSSFCHEFTNPDPDMVLACFKSFQMDSGGLREAGILLGLMKKQFLSDSETNFVLPYYTLFKRFWAVFQKSSFCHEFTNPDPDMVLACFKSFQMDSGGLREAGIIAWISATLAKTDSPSRNLWILLRKGISSWNRMRWAEIGGVSGLFNLSGHGEWLPCFRLFTEIFSAGHVPSGESNSISGPAIVNSWQKLDFWKIAQNRLKSV